MLLTISAFVIASVAWAALTQVKELTIAPGQIIPRGQIESVQHLEGGIVAEIYVHEGEYVTARQPVIRLRPESAISERNQYEARRAGLSLQLIRLEAQSRNEAPHFGELGRQFPDLAAEQEKLN
jgi:adhesin transport system membrane fusion protein